MTDMVERVARALAEQAINWSCCEYCAARAAIEAMREPTNPMIFASGPVYNRGQALEVWQAMIDAALKAPP